MELTQILVFTLLSQYRLVEHLFFDCWSVLCLNSKCS